MENSSAQKINVFRDASLWLLLCGNVFAIAMALWRGWDPAQVMWIYWAQSVMIGYTSYRRMMGLKEFSTLGMTVNDRTVPETEQAKKDIANFFAVHYGAFHLAYLAVLCQEHPLTGVGAANAAILVLCALVFVKSHGFSLKYNGAADFRQKKPYLGTMMAYPYMRILPMHAISLVGIGTGMEGMLLFMGLKTVADCGMHMVEHHLYRKPDKVVPTVRDK